MIKKLAILLLLLVLSSQVFAQETTVPNVTGLNVPQAAALLNKSGLRLGAENNVGWSAESGLAENTVSSQSVAEGALVAFGASVDVTVLRSANAAAIYDDNDLTLLNNTGGDLNLAGITFVAVDGAGAQLAGSRWAGSLRDTQCTQVWSVGRNGAKALDDCSTIQNWLVTTNSAEHFWTGAGGTTQFNVLQNGVARATCAVTNPGRCDFFLSGGSGAGDVTEYVYMAYGADQLAIINQSPDQWMALAGYTVLNYFSPTQGAPVPVGDATLYTRFPPDVEDVTRLAPGQCILFSKASIETETPPQPCEIISKLLIGDDLIFWGAGFGMLGSDGNERTCPVGAADRLTICVMPR